MKKLILSFTFLMAGCCSVPDETYASAKENARIFDLYVDEMEAGRTTPAEDQEFIKAAWERAQAFNYAINDIAVPQE